MGFDWRLHFNNANLAPFTSSTTSLADLKSQYAVDPIGKIRNFTETYTSFMLTAGYKYDSLFKSKKLGQRIQFGASVGIPMFYSVVNTAQPQLEFSSTFEGIDLGVSAGYGWRFTEKFSLMMNANYYYRVREELKKLYETRAEAFNRTGVDLGRDRYSSIPENEISYWNLGVSAFWDF